MTALPNDWLYPPPGGWTLADVENLPEDCRIEVIDGTLIVNASPLPIHQRIVRRLTNELETQLPDRWQIELDVDVLLSEEPLTYLTPDVVVFAADVPLTTRPIRAESILLVVEVVSRGSRSEDRGAKPLAFADAGIPHAWRIENPASGALATEAHTFVLDPTIRAYTPTGIHRGRLALDEPFTVDVDLDALTR